MERAGWHRARFLERALLFTIVAHLAGMLAMPLFLLPGLPGGMHEEVADRAAYVAANPWLWRVGWLAWQVTAVSDVLLCIALLRMAWAPKVPAVLALLATLVGFVPDQVGQALWTWEGVRLAEAAVGSGAFGEYAAFEGRVFALSALWGTIGYLLGALGWTWCFAAAGVWFRWLTWASVGAWGTFALATSVLFLPAEVRERPEMRVAVAIGNAVAFVLLMAWFAGVTEAVLRLSRPGAEHGSLAVWRHPHGGLLARAADLVANSRLARAIGGWAPTPPLASDITNVLYINYLVEAERLQPLATPPLQVQRIGPAGRYALFTVLCFQHGNYGPAWLGPLRRAFPSPSQSNWRIYVENAATGTTGVQFLSTSISSTWHALMARLLADGVPMHVPHTQELLSHSGGLRVRIDHGTGSAPDLDAAVTPCPRGLPKEWQACFETYGAFLDYCVPQDRAMVVQSLNGQVFCQDIELAIDRASCEAMTGEVTSQAVRRIVGDATPVCFRVPSVGFRFRCVRLDCERQGRHSGNDRNGGPVP